MEAIESSFVLDRQIHSVEVYKKFHNFSKVLGDSIMKNSVTIRILQINGASKNTRSWEMKIRSSEESGAVFCLL